MKTQGFLRKSKRIVRQSIPVEEKKTNSQSIIKKIINDVVYKKAKNIIAYLCMPEEVDVYDFIRYAWQDKKDVYLPVVVERGEALKFALYNQDTELVSGIFGIKTPKLSNSIYMDCRDIDLVITPLVAFDNNLNRVGMGGGFYDRTFAFKKDHKILKPTLIGVAFEKQKTNECIKVNEWDIKLDKIITEMAVY